MLPRKQGCDGGRWPHGRQSQTAMGPAHVGTLLGADEGGRGPCFRGGADVCAIPQEEKSCTVFENWRTVNYPVAVRLADVGRGDLRSGQTDTPPKPNQRKIEMRLEELKSSRSKPSQPGGVLVCSKCGEKNTDDARACKACKQSLYINCAVCGHENLRASPRCISCTHHLRPTIGRQLRKWVFEKHGMLILKVMLVLGVSFVAAHVILKVAEVEPAEPKEKATTTGDAKFKPAPNAPEMVNLEPKVTPTSKKPAAKPGAPATENDPLEGWRERYCAATVASGIVTVTGKALNKKNPSITGPFLASYAQYCQFRVLLRWSGGFEWPAGFRVSARENWRAAGA